MIWIVFPSPIPHQENNNKRIKEMKAMTSFCGGFEKNHFEHFHRELFKTFLDILYEKEKTFSTCILTFSGIITVSLHTRIANNDFVVILQYGCVCILSFRQEGEIPETEGGLVFMLQSNCICQWGKLVPVNFATIRKYTRLKRKDKFVTVVSMSCSQEYNIIHCLCSF